MRNMADIERISRMEDILDQTSEAFGAILAALEKYEASLDGYKELCRYYAGDWLSDYEDDEKGRLPKDLKRGVLSQDAVFDLMAEYRSIKEELSRLSKI